MRRASPETALATLLAASTLVADPQPGGAPKTETPIRFEITNATTFQYALDNRDFAPNQVATVVNDDWGVWYNRFHTEVEHGSFRFGLRLDNAWFYASPDATETALELVRTRPDDATNLGDPAYFRAKVGEAGRELSNRYINWVYPAKYWAGWTERDADVTVGDVYAELGHGLVLSVRKRDELASDDTVRGARANGRLRVGDGRLGLSVLGGSLNPLRIDETSGRYLGVGSSVTPGWLAVTEAGMPRAIETDFASETGDCRTDLTCSYAPDRLLAGQLTFAIARTRVATQGSLLVRQSALSADVVRSARRIATGSGSLETAAPGGNATLYVEVAGQKLTHDTGARALDAGHAVYATATLIELPWLFLLEAKHYRRFFPLYANVSVARAREFSLVSFSAPPTGEAVFIDSEYEGFNTCVSGARARADHQFSRRVLVFGWFGYWQTFAETVVNERCSTDSRNRNDVFDLASGLEATSRDGGSRATLSFGSRFDDAEADLATPEGRTHVFYRELYARYNVARALGGPFTLELQGVHRRRRRTLGGPGSPWFEGEHVTGIDVGAEWSFGAGFEYETNPQTPDTFINVLARYRPTPASSLALFAGQRRGSLRCVGGICRVMPGFEGVRLDATMRF